MKKICYLLLLTVSFTFANNPKSFELKQNEPKVGDILIINAQTGSAYNHIDFPKLNFIVKRGGIANYNSVHGNHVVVKEVIVNENGMTQIVLERQDKSKFFGFLKQVEANFTKAIAAGEISKK
ncbi:hypothetical protein QLS71_013775 [Mariniflexile litorale]|uniref:Uncharacterized protein n=1 Tax=Mariniflexile litorale TaxID=3045158 RepID=A0AAU7ECM3_9FLAO|nr:hypothetical protein [Mariniflexile sp. KMM 9835]MDQ8212071.1 hypothetical protein [Mariniflexile sp. KMM 9835]